MAQVTCVLERGFKRNELRTVTIFIHTGQQAGLQPGSVNFRGKFRKQDTFLAMKIVDSSATCNSLGG